MNHSEVEKTWGSVIARNLILKVWAWEQNGSFLTVENSAVLTLKRKHISFSSLDLTSVHINRDSRESMPCCSLDWKEGPVKKNSLFVCVRSKEHRYLNFLGKCFWRVFRHSGVPCVMGEGRGVLGDPTGSKEHQYLNFLEKCFGRVFRCSPWVIRNPLFRGAKNWIRLSQGATMSNDPILDAIFHGELESDP